MDSLGSDLLLLMLNLSRMRDRERIMRLFVEALSVAVPGVSVRYLAAGDETDGEIVDVATPEAHFGRVTLEDPAGVLTAQDRSRYRNAVRMLGVVLENIARAERLADENNRLDLAVAARTAELERSLTESNDLYQNASCGYHSLDASGVYVRVNDTELSWLGYRRGELVGKMSFENLLSEDTRQTFARAFAALKEHGVVKEVELELLRKDGTRLPVLQSASAVVDAQGRFVMSRATISDLSERRKAERDLRESEERFWQSQKLEAIGRLAGGIAHDFNNLLTVILACSQMLHEGLEPTSVQRQDTESIVDAANKAAALTRQLLAFGRRQATQPVPADLGAIVAGMAKMLERLIGEDVELEISRGQSLRLVQADPGQLEQVVLNLAVNARDAMPDGGRLLIETSNSELMDENQSEPRRCAMLAVSDTGSGIAPEARVRLFEPFFTTKPKGKGTGLGLATVYGIVKQAGGTIRVDSAAGQGTRFEVIFPATNDDGPAVTAGEPEALHYGTGTILLVDDEAGVRSATARVLREAGYQVLEAGSGEQALELAAKTDRLDLLLTDAVMPRMSGPQLDAELRRSRPHLKVIIMSGYADADRCLMSEPAERVGTFFQKPFTIGALTRAVAEQLAHSPAPGPPSDSAPPDLAEPHEA